MADSITKLGAFELLRIDPNWAKDLSNDYAISRRIISNLVSPTLLEPLSPEMPISLSLGFLCCSKIEKKELLEFWISKRARLMRWWLLNPLVAFNLAQTAGQYDVGIYCLRNRFDLSRRGHERIYILHSSGDLIIRKVTSSIDIGGRTYIGFDSNLGRELTIGNVLKIGYVLLGRFNTDKINFVHKTNTISEATLTFVELIKEYSLAG